MRQWLRLCLYLRQRDNGENEALAKCGTGKQHMPVKRRQRIAGRGKRPGIALR